MEEKSQSCGGLLRVCVFPIVSLDRQQHQHPHTLADKLRGKFKQCEDNKDEEKHTLCQYFVVGTEAELDLGQTREGGEVLDQHWLVIITVIVRDASDVTHGAGLLGGT